MRMLMSFLCPPIAVLMCGKWGQGLIVSPLLTLCFWVPGIIHALVVVNNAQKAEREHQMLMMAARSTIISNARR
jgi:uncharacterized membrane protein YqaE (UPF0057 family)